MTPSPPSPPDPVPEEPLAEVGREPLHAAIASAREERRGGISVGTLGVASVASAAAAYTASHLWGSGTVLSAALTPVIVALVSEFLRRPVDRVSATVAPIIPRPPLAGQVRPSEVPPAGPPTAVDSPGWAPVNYGDPPRPHWRPRWRLVLATGVLAFAIVVAIYTLPELVVGHSITGAGGSGTFLPGGVKAAPVTTTPATTTTVVPTQTVTVQVQTTTVTVPATTSTDTVPTAAVQTGTTTTSTTTTPTATTPAP